MFDSHNDIFFVVDSAYPKSIVPATPYLDQAKGGSNITSLFESDGHRLEVFGTLNLLLNFEQMPYHHCERQIKL